MATATATQTKTAGTVGLKQFIDGRWTQGTGKNEIRSVNPADTRQVLAQCRGASRQDALRALEAAQKAFPRWRAVPAPSRARIIEKVVHLARERKEELARILTLEEGKIFPEALGELEKGINLLEWYAGEGLRFMGHTAPSELPKNLLFTVREPLGIVSAITPWNFPWAILCWKIAPALVAGNTVVLKPSSLTPWLAVEFVKLFESAGLPQGALNLVIGAGSEVGDVLVEDERIEAVSFTGSNEVGVRVHALAGKRGVRVTCEMGGKNPCLVWKDADLELALAGIVKGAFGSTGQRCTATSRLILHEEVADSLVWQIVEFAGSLKIGDGLKPGIGLGPLIDANQLHAVLKWIEIGKKEGAKILCGGKRFTAEGCRNGWFVEPTVFDQVTPSMKIAQEEIFGPVLSVFRVRDFEEAVRISNHTRFGLTSAIYTQNLSLALRFIEESQVGMVHVNSPTIGGEAQVPFGGVKASGVGEREMAKEGILFFSKPKTVFLDYTGKKRESNIY
ncbi:MAG: aldehyde dehydrogenase family protein [Elusimicrobia bacterium]|nr:aldehyde dehydrogenase family protein [Elusimicrobiota bacterium]